jgi:hypothetical protein
MQIGSVDLPKLQHEVVNLTYQLTRLRLLVEWLQMNNQNMTSPNEQEWKVLDGSAQAATRETWGDTVRFVEDENPIQELEARWNQMAMVVLQVQNVSKVNLRLESGPLNEAIVHGGLELQGPFRRMIEKAAEPLGYTVTYA